MTSRENTQILFDYLITAVKEGKVEPVVCAKRVMVDACFVTPEEYGKDYIVWSHGQVEKTFKLGPDMVLVTTLNEKAQPVIDEKGNTNTYDLSTKKFHKTYTKEIDGHYVKDPYAPTSVMIAVKIPENLIPENGLTFFPPNWGGYEGTLMKNGVVMLPFNPALSLIEQIDEWKKEGIEKLDFYPNNEPDTYSCCDKNGTFENENLRKSFEQGKAFEGNPYKQRY